MFNFPRSIVDRYITSCCKIISYQHTKTQRSITYENCGKNLFNRPGVSLNGGGLIFAQAKSYTYAATNGTLSSSSDVRLDKNRGLIRTDVDNFIDENNWSSVNAENMFGFLGYNFGGNNINFGLSRQFDKFYGAFFFGGKLGSFNTDANTTKISSSGEKSKESRLTAGNDGNFTMSALLGTGNMGFKAKVSYNPTGITNTDSTAASGVKTKNYSENYILSPALSWGLNSSVGENPFQLYLGTSLDANVNKTAVTTMTGGKQTTAKTDSSTYIWNIYGNIEFERENGSVFSSVLGSGLHTNFVFTGNDADTTSHGNFLNNVFLDPYYTAEINPVESLVLKARAKAMVLISTNIATKYTETNGTRTYNTNRDDYVNVSLRPSLELASQWMIKKDVVAFNAGASFAVPYMEWQNYSTKTCSAAGEVQTTKSGVEYNFYTASGAVTLSSGFEVFFGKNVTLDVNWNILGNIFNGMTADFANGTTTEAFFGNFNKVLFGSDIALLLSVKF